MATEQRVRALHRAVDIEPSETICHECSIELPDGSYVEIEDHPCPTIVALDGGQ